MNAAPPSASAFRLGEWTIHPDRNLLENSTDSKRVTPKEMRLLTRLVRDAGNVVSKQDLLDDVWDGDAVVEHVVAKTLSSLRRALDDRARSPVYIETVPKRGYRLLIAPEAAESHPERTAEGSSRSVLAATDVRCRASQWKWLAACALSALSGAAAATLGGDQRADPQPPEVIKVAVVAKQPEVRLVIKQRIQLPVSPDVWERR